MNDDRSITIEMTRIFCAICALVIALSSLLTSKTTPFPVSKKDDERRKSERMRTTKTTSSFQCDRNESKRLAELFILKCSFIWILSIAVVIFFQLYESFTKWHYLWYCMSCASLYVAWPMISPISKLDENERDFRKWYIMKANVWIGILSFVGNYVWTHYFYNVLNARYTFDAHRLNDVPIAMYFMTHAYFMFYHCLTNMVLRKIKRDYLDDRMRFLFTSAVVMAMAYTTAFMETLTICAFPYWEFENRALAYSLGSAFYGIYFIVSFPMFLLVDEDPEVDKYSMWRVIWESLGSCMLVTLLLDFVRLLIGVEFKMK